MMHLRNRLPYFAATLLASLSLVASASAENLKVINFQTKVGSFKLLGSEHPAHGQLEISFTGTVLVSGLGSGAVSTTGSILKEYDNAPHKKLVYHGTGKVVVNGDFTAVQFFGQNLTGRFTGVGIFRFYGEFDKDLNTGQYWYDNGDKHDWGTGGMQVTVPGYRPKDHPGLMGPSVKIKGSLKS